jgi:ABC-2 type transport system permease protein
MKCYDIARREFSRLTTHPVYLFSMMGIPLFCAVFFLTLLNEGAPTNLPAAVADLDNTPASRTLSRQLDAFQKTQITMRTASFAEARREMQEKNIYGIYLIPRNFTADVNSGKQPLLSFYINASYLIPSAFLLQDMKTVSVLANVSAGLQQGAALGHSPDQTMAALRPVDIDVHPLGNPWFNYSVYLSNTLLPGILQLMIFLVTVYSLATEIRDGTARAWLQMGDDSLTRSLLGKLLPHTLVFTATGFACCALMLGFGSFPLHGGWLPLLTAMFLLVVASQGVGVFMMGLLPVPRLGLGIAALFGVLSFSFAGLSFPVSDMHPSLQACSNLFPLRHYFLICTDQALYGRSWFSSWPQYIALLCFPALPFLIGRHLRKALLFLRYIP